MFFFSWKDYSVRLHEKVTRHEKNTHLFPLIFHYCDEMCYTRCRDKTHSFCGVSPLSHQSTWSSYFYIIYTVLGEPLVPGQSYSFPGGSFTLSDHAVVIRPDMIHNCSGQSSEYADLYVDKLCRIIGSNW